MCLARMLETPSSGALDAACAKRGHNAAWLALFGHASPASHHQGRTAPVSNHMTDGTLRDNLSTPGREQPSVLVREHAGRLAHARSILERAGAMNLSLCDASFNSELVWLVDVKNTVDIDTTGLVAPSEIVGKLDLIHVKEHRDVAAVVRTALCHFDGRMRMLSRPLPDYEQRARSWLSKLGGGLLRLVAEQKRLNIEPPSIYDEPTQVKRQHKATTSTKSAKKPMEEAEPKPTASTKLMGPKAKKSRPRLHRPLDDFLSDTD